MPVTRATSFLSECGAYGSPATNREMEIDNYINDVAYLATQGAQAPYPGSLSLLNENMIVSGYIIRFAFPAFIFSLNCPPLNRIQTFSGLIKTTLLCMAEVRNQYAGAHCRQNQTRFRSSHPDIMSKEWWCEFCTKATQTYSCGAQPHNTATPYIRSRNLCVHPGVIFKNKNSQTLAIKSEKSWPQVFSSHHGDVARSKYLMDARFPIFIREKMHP